MTIHTFLTDYQIAICVLFDAEDKSYTVYKNNSAELSHYSLFDNIVIHSDYEYLESVRDEKLLPRVWSQGRTKCCIFPAASGKTVCLFFESDSDSTTNYCKCKEYMNLFQTIAL